jgi:hypothetical protein
MLAGDILFEVGEGSGGTGGGDIRWLNGDCPKPGLNPVGSAKLVSTNNLYFSIIFSGSNLLVCMPLKLAVFWNDGVGPKPLKLPPEIPVGCGSIGLIEGNPVGCCIIG